MSLCQALIDNLILIQAEEEKKEKKNRKDHWLHKDIVVKVVTKKLGEKYYKKKAVVRVRVTALALLISC